MATPKIAVVKAWIFSINEPCNKSAGLNTKKNGTKYIIAPKRIAANPARIGATFATEAAANAANATGGVIKLNIPQYITNI